MIALLQRVSSAKVEIGAEIHGEISEGLLALIGVQKGDSLARAQRLCERIVAYRLFEDEKGRMNRSLEDISGQLLLVPQFTLAANTNKGNRPSFTPAASPELAETLFDQLVKHSKTRINHVATGRFGADMQVSLTNNGPVTFWLES